jgi:hypothetical protein
LSGLGAGRSEKIGRPFPNAIGWTSRAYSSARFWAMRLRAKAALPVGEDRLAVLSLQLGDFVRQVAAGHVGLRPNSKNHD